MSTTPNGQTPGREEILRSIDRTLPRLPRELQNMAAAYARGIQQGIALRAAMEGGAGTRPTAADSVAGRGPARAAQQKPAESAAKEEPS